MVNIVERFEGDNIKTQHGGSGKECYSPAGFAYALERHFANKLAHGKIRDVNGAAAEKISENVVKMEKVARNNTNTKGGAAR